MGNLFFWILVVYSILSVLGTIAAAISILVSGLSWKEKFLWLLVVIFVPLGWLIYFLLK